MRVKVVERPPGYGSPVEFPDGEPAVADNLEVELPVSEWRCIRPLARPLPRTVYFVDGIQRTDANLLVERDDGVVVGGLCGSYSAGAIRTSLGSAAELVHMQMGRKLFSTTRLPPARLSAALLYESHPATTIREGRGEQETLVSALRGEMVKAEESVLRAVIEDKDALYFRDGGIYYGQLNPPEFHGRAVMGYIKSHSAQYLPKELVSSVVMSLAPGQRSPVFGTTHGCYSWYVRLPGKVGHVWESVARVETMNGKKNPLENIMELADLSCLLLPTYATPMHIDPRSPVNLLPIRALERVLRRRLGARAYIAREIRVKMAQALGNSRELTGLM
jgi:hypothetical protein